MKKIVLLLTMPLMCIGAEKMMSFVHVGPLQKIGYCSEGEKKEDAVAIHALGEKNLFTLCDGHSGKDAASLVAQKLCDMVMANPNSIYHSVEDGFKNKLHSLEKECLVSCKGATSVLAAYLDQQEKNNLHITWVGSVRALVIRNGKLIDATQDHDLNNVAELKRVQAAKGVVWRQIQDDTKAPWRINGSRNTRIIGSKIKKDKFFYFRNIRAGLALEVYPGLKVEEIKVAINPEQIIADPEYKNIKLEERDNWLILVTKGVSDILSNKNIVDIFNESKSEGPTAIATKLVQIARAKNKKDDVSAIVVDLLSL